MTKKISFNQIHNGDTRELVAMLPDRSISVTLSSPPYWNLKDYGVKNQIGYDQSYDQYMDELVQIFRHVYRATKDTGSLWIVIDTFKTDGNLRLLPYEFANRLQLEIGWLLQDIIVWDKGKTLPWSRTGQLRNQFEYLLCFSKKKEFKYEIDRLKEISLKEWWVKYPERYNPKGKVPSNIWTLPIPVQGSWSTNGLRHACPFPISLVERIVLLTTEPKKNNVVLDPFAGSGIVLAVADQMKRGYLGFELNKKFIQMYRSAVRNYVSKELLSRTKQVTSLKEQRKKLEGQILKLRLLKYPKVLLKLLNASVPEAKPTHCNILALSPNSKVIVSTTAEPHHVASLKIIIVVEKVKNHEDLIHKIDQIRSRPPLSKFGINAQVTVISLDELIALQPSFGISKRTQLWVYKKGITHKYSGNTNLAKWINDLIMQKSDVNNKKCPTIVSNIAISQKIERTWFPKESE